MSGNTYSSKEIFGILSFVVVSVGIAIGAYQLGQNIGGAGQNEGAEMQPAAVTTTINGQTLYATNCIGCHGAKGEGGVGPALATSATWSEAEFGLAIKQGKAPSRELAPTMPRFAQLDGQDTSDEQVAALHEYIKSLQ